MYSSVFSLMEEEDPFLDMKREIVYFQTSHYILVFRTSSRKKS